MISRLGTETGIEAPELLSSLSEAFREDGVERQRLAQRARLPCVLDLHLVPQIKLADAALAFSCLGPSYPLHWKQQVRQLRNRLTHFDQDVKLGDQPGVRVVSLISLEGARGRHGIAANLAFALASMEEAKVLYIDARGTHAELAKHLGLDSAIGLCEASRAQREDLPAAFRRISGTQLYLLPYGGLSPLDGEPIDPRGLQRLLEGLRQQFDWIIIDGPGFDTPADASMVTFCSDGTLYLVNQGIDRFEDLRQALRQTQGRYMLGAVML